MNDVLLDAAEMKAFNSRLGALTHGRVSVGPEAINRGQARALWAAMKAFGAPARAPSSPRPPRRRSGDFSRSGALAAVSAAVALSGCTTLGGNVKGDFACRAPDGICAPTSKIDDQALAMISGGDAETVPTGVIDPYDRADPQFLRTSASAAPGRSSEKVLRIVFPAHVDRLGRFREASAIHAVVERGAWMAAADVRAAPLAAQTGEGRPQLASAAYAPSLAELAASSPEVVYPHSAADPAATQTAPLAVQADPNAPSPAAVASARKRGRVVRTRMQTSALVPATLPSPKAQTASVQLASAAASPNPSAGMQRSSSSSLVTSPSGPAKSAASTAVTLPVSGPAYDLRAAVSNAQGVSPVHAIREQVGAILAARTGHAPAPVNVGPPAAAAAATPERPVNNPSVLAVSGVEPQ